MWNMTTASGVDFGEAASALQKCCRRALVDDAIYWMVDLYDAGYGEYVWRRLFIIAAEDVGLANPALLPLLDAAYNAWQREMKRPDGGEARLFITQAVMAVALSPKSRDVDNMLVYHFARHDEAKRPVPDFAIDKHTGRGKRMKRGWDHFWEIGSLLSPEEYPVSPELTAAWRQRARETLDMCKLPPDGNKAAKAGRNDKSRKTAPEPEPDLFHG